MRRTGGATRGSITVLSYETTFDRIPMAVVETGESPPGLLLPKVDDRAVVEVRRPDRTGGSLPGLIADDALGLPVRGVDLQLGDQAELLAVVAPVTFGIPAQPPPIPTIAKDRCDDVAAFLQKAGDVIGGGEQSMSVGRPSGIEKLVTDRGPVDRDIRYTPSAVT